MVSQMVEFTILLFILAWVLQQCSTNTVSVIVSTSYMCLISRSSLRISLSICLMYMHVYVCRCSTFLFTIYQKW